MKPWVKTDHEQWVRESDENNYTVLNVTLYDNEYILHEVHVDFSQISDEELSKHVSGYYESLEHVKNEYAESWKMIVAKIFSKNTPADRDYDDTFDSQEALYEHLRDEYGIEA